MKYILTFVSLLVFFLNANAQTVPVHQITFKDGLYRNIREFLTDSPSLKSVSSAGVNAYDVTKPICENKLYFIENGKVSEIESKEIWGFTLNGVPFVRHRHRQTIEINLSKPCFVPLVSVGSFSLYYLQEIEYNHNAFMGANGMPSTQRSIEINEYVIDTRTDEVYSLKTDKTKILKLIKEHPKFSDRKLKKRDIMIHIFEYNEVVPITIE